MVGSAIAKIYNFVKASELCSTKISQKHVIVIIQGHSTLIRLAKKVYNFNVLRVQL